MATIYQSNQSNHNESYVDAENLKTTIKMFQDFLREFEQTSQEEEQKIIRPYHDEAFNMLNSKRTTMYINFYHLMKYNNFHLIEAIHLDYYKYEPSIRAAVFKFISELYPEYARQKIFYVSFYNLHELDTIRTLKTDKLGKLIALKGTLTKTSEVRPELLVGNFVCQICGMKSGLKEQQFKYTIPNKCMNKTCTNQTKFELVNEGSIFVDWQKIKIQEASYDMPSGSMPRSIDVILRHEQVEKAQPGDRVIISGSLVVVPDIPSMMKPGEKHELSSLPENKRVRTNNNLEGQGISGNGGIDEINYKMVFLANNIMVSETKFQDDNQKKINFDTQDQIDQDYLATLTDQDKKEIEQIRNQQNLFDKLADLIAPFVLGNREIKKGILLMLFGGVNKLTRDGMKIRGDINLCIVGDPSTAKSQFLKFVYNYIPRTIYTSGRGSTSAGLTAALVKDSETGEFTLEAGALMLADNGICCIDEFDKMLDKDVVAIHEAMEQQTISITKAGIQATLNARCSILAALNPNFGRYQKTKNLKQNINLSPPLMSRFDIFFVVIDECNATVDTAIAKQIVGYHKDVKMQEEFPNVDQVEKKILTQQSLMRYLRFAKHINPQITPDAAKMLSQVYQRMRMNEFSLQRSAYRITVRQLESLIRLSEACARVHCSFQVTTEHVRAAVQLLNKSIIKIEAKDLELFDEDDMIFNQKELNKLGKDQENIKQGMEVEKEDGEDKKEEVQKKKKQRLKVTSDNYRRIQKGLEHIMRRSQHEDMSLEALTLAFIDSELAEIDSLNQLENYQKLVRLIIKRMITNEKIFVKFKNDQNDDIIRFHPGYNLIQVLCFILKVNQAITSFLQVTHLPSFSSGISSSQGSSISIGSKSSFFIISLKSV